MIGWIQFKRGIQPLKKSCYQVLKSERLQVIQKYHVRFPWTHYSFYKPYEKWLQLHTATSWVGIHLTLFFCEYAILTCQWIFFLQILLFFLFPKYFQSFQPSRKDIWQKILDQLVKSHSNWKCTSLYWHIMRVCWCIES
jgi:hypothetical protein